MMFSDSTAISAHYDTAHAQSSSSYSRPEHPDARHECEVCGRKFTQRAYLNTHLRAVHNVGDTQTFKCDVCAYVTKYKSDLKRHLSHVHGFGDVQTAQCDICSKIFKSKMRLQQHIRRCHKQVA